MLDLSFISIPLMLTINAFGVLWICLSIADLTKKKKQIKIDSLNSNHFVSVIVPAKDEGAVILNILKDLVASTYKKLEVIVVCHNCIDDTFKLASEFAKTSSASIKVYDYYTTESGKGLALNYGLGQAKGDLIVYFDTDNHVPTKFIEKMVAWTMRGYDAAQSRIRAKSTNNLLCSMQDLENAVFIPMFFGGKTRLGLNAGIGGTGVIVTRKAVDAIGGFHNVLIEDFDFFLRLTIAKYKVAFADDCVVYDEKVETWTALVKQRSRWLAGHFQLIKSIPFKTKLRLLFRDPVNFIQLFNPAGLVATYLSLPLMVLAWLGLITYAYVPLTVWATITLVMNTLFALIIRRDNNGHSWSMIKQLPLFYLFSLHWYLALIKALFVKSWGSTKTVHTGN